MDSPYNTLRFYTQFVTGMVLLLNIALLVSIRLNMKLGVRAPNGERPERPKKGVMATLMITVIVLNVAALYTNHKLRQTVKEVLVQAGLIEPETK